VPPRVVAASVALEKSAMRQPADVPAVIAIAADGYMTTRHVSRVLSPVAAAAAALYFLIDAVFLSAVRTIIRPLARALSGSRMFKALAAWLASLGPYPTLVLFLVPVIILEPVKPSST
jgi:hypothetical protein